MRPKADATAGQIDSLDPQYFEARPHIEEGPHGRHLFDAKDETRPEGVSTTIPYPIYREPESLRRYVTLDATTEPPRRHYLDGETVGVSPVGDYDNDRESPEDFESFDDDEPF